MTQAHTSPTTQTAPTAPAAPQDRRYFLRVREADSLFSGDRLKEIDPERYGAIAEMIADGVLSRRQIAQIAGVSPNTVRAIEDSRAGGSIDAIRARLSALCASIEGATLDRIREALEDPDPEHAPTLRDLAAILREVGSRSDLLAGRPTAIIGHEAGSVEQLAQANAARRARLREMSIDAEARIVEPRPAIAEAPARETHSCTETAAPRETAPADPRPADAQADPHPARLEEPEK